ncbi:MAG: orotidine 5'-phosphate decarboxylase [Vezdaea aestivalis]|nr:MAG: orotidine 5'-phosphate decarboxylase [Vezdaea aestivalis]
MAPQPHPTLKQTYANRADHPDIHPLAHYLLHLMTVKKSNLCLSADVSTTAELLRLAEDLGDKICVLKTHADAIDDFSDRAYKRLIQVANRKKFLIFEDRKFGDIGSTVQRQYTSGPLQIAQWASLTNAHVFPGPAIISALKQAATRTLSAFNSSVKTDITASPITRPTDIDDNDPPTDDEVNSSDAAAEMDFRQHSPGRGYTRTRLGSMHSIETTTTIETYTEPLSPFAARRDSSRHKHSPSASRHAASKPDIEQTDMARQLQELGNPPLDRALLLLAEMSSEGNLMGKQYTQTCVNMARAEKDFVLGFIAQHGLNSEPNDRFVIMTPGVSLPPEGLVKNKGKSGDGLGQRYNTPRKMILEMGCDVVIVGRGILAADDVRTEAERYRVEAWAAYLDRVGG